MGNKYKAIVRTLLYSDLFDFPLTESELFYYLLTDTRIFKSEFRQALTRLLPHLTYKKPYIALPNREDIIQKRKDNEQWLTLKRKEASQIAQILSYIPTIYFIGLSGGVGVGSSNKDDDIDFFIITKKNCIYITRLIALLILAMLGKRRRREEKNAKDKICLNMFLDESSLSLPLDRHDIYTAHEIAQIYPLVDRNNTYLRFLSANQWIATFLAHAALGRKVRLQKLQQSLGENLLRILEPIARYVQVKYIKRHKTKEIVTSNFIAFHPIDYRSLIIKNYEQKVRNYLHKFSRLFDTIR